VDRARQIVTRLTRRLRAVLSLCAVPLVAAGCDTLLGDPDRVVALELVGPASRTVTVGDTLLLVVRAVTAGGDTVPGAAVTWAVLDTGAVGFALDPALGRVIGEAPGKGNVQAAYEDLRTDAIAITVVAALAVWDGRRGGRAAERQAA